MCHRCTRLLAVVFVFLMSARSLRATTYDWSNSSGGTFGNAANWTPIGGAPNSNDTARFSLNNTYMVTLTNSTTVDTLSQTQGDVTLNLGSGSFAASNTANNTLGSAGVTTSLDIAGGFFFPGGFSVGSVPDSTSNLILDTGSITAVGFGPFYVGSSGTGNLTLRNGATLSTPVATALGLNASGVGTATISGSGSAWTITNVPLRVGSFGTGTLNILANGSVTAFGLEVGENLDSIGTVSLSGSLATFTTAGTANIGGSSGTLPAASASLNVGTGSTMNLNGTTNFRTNAKVNMLGGTLNLSTVNLTTGATFNWSSGTVNFATAPTITTSILNTLLAGTHTLGPNCTLSATAGTFTLGSTLILNGGTISVPTLDVNANTTLHAFSTITAANTVTLEPGITVQLDDFSTLRATTSISNNGGTLQLNGSLANVTGPVTNNGGFIRGTGRFVAGLNNAAAGTVRLETGDHIIIDTVAPTNVGTIELAGGTIEYSKALSNQAGGIITGRGVFRGSSSAPGGTGLNNQGVLSFSAGITDIFGDVNNTGSGKIIAAGGSTVTFYDDVVHNGSEIRTNSGSRTVFFGAVTGAGPFTGTGDVELNGDLKPGNSPAAVTFGGNVQIGSTAGLNIELGGPTKGAQYDSLTIAGNASPSGALKVTLINGFVPSPGQWFEVITAGAGVEGAFDTTSVPALSGGLYLNTIYSPTAVTLNVAGILGDYNHSGTVDSADYITWRKSLGQTGPGLAADGNANGQIDSGDLDTWRAHFGESGGSGSAIGVTSLAVPESISLMVLAWTIAAGYRARWVRRTR